ncbi:hypothetical protein D9M69_380100 [compost metagenome]
MTLLRLINFMAPLLKGMRSEYAPAFFGELYSSLQAIKGAFDPYNQLNPGKIATPQGSNEELVKIDEVAMRGEPDRQIDERVWQSYGTAVHCNGNGACYNFDPDDAMCPSWKATRDRVHSPKGRASLLREWLRLQGQAGVDVLKPATGGPLNFLRSLPERWRNTRKDEEDFSHEVYAAMAGCLACKSCAGQCPIKVDVPEFRSRFLELYHRRYLRPLRDYLIGSLEYTLPFFARVPWLYNGPMGSSRFSSLLAKRVGMVASPLISRFDFDAICQRWNVVSATPGMLDKLSQAERKNGLILVQDAFTRYFETPVFAAFIELASRIGFQVYLAPYSPNGKPLHVQGFLNAFLRTAKRTAGRLQAISNFGVPLVGLDPAMTLVYRQEYARIPGLQCPQVMLPQEWLINALRERPQTSSNNATYRLLAHCTEKTNAASSAALWKDVFAQARLELQIQAVGCCGMSGTYGHEARNLESSRTIFSQSWEPALKSKNAAEPLATGYSCRSQAARMNETKLRHPIQVLLEHLTDPAS